MSLGVGLSSTPLTAFNYLQGVERIGARYLVLQMVVSVVLIAIHLLHAGFSKRASDDVYLAVG